MRDRPLTEAPLLNARAALPLLRGRRAGRDPDRARADGTAPGAAAEERSGDSRRQPQLASRYAGADVAPAVAAAAEGAAGGGGGLFPHLAGTRLVCAEHHRHHSGRTRRRRKGRQPACGVRGRARPRRDPHHLPGRIARRAGGVPGFQEGHRPSRQGEAKGAGDPGLHAWARQGTAEGHGAARALQLHGERRRRLFTARSPTTALSKTWRRRWLRSPRKRSCRCGLKPSRRGPARR